MTLIIYKLFLRIIQTQGFAFTADAILIGASTKMTIRHGTADNFAGASYSDSFTGTFIHWDSI